MPSSFDHLAEASYVMEAASARHFVARLLKFLLRLPTPPGLTPERL
jgi:hypothetical protein